MSDTATANAGEKQRRGRFRKGESGNPSGKRPGTRNRATRAAETLLDGEAEALTRKAIEMALAGDTAALRLCLDRVLPPRKGRPISIALPHVTRAADARAALASVIDAISAGKITPDEAATVCIVIEAQGRQIEADDFEARPQAIEQRTTDKKP
jgi:hypothetical protein